MLCTHRPGLTETEAGLLAAALGDLPLALAQAGGFLAETGMPADQYLNLLTTRAGELLDSLAAAIRLTTDRLAQDDPAALALARIGAFLAPEPIPAEVLTTAVAPDGHIRPPELQALAVVVASPVAAHRSLGRLGRYGLGRVDSGLRLHRLTQAVLRAQLDTGQAAAYHAYAQALLAAVEPGDERDPATWPSWARLLPHLLATDPASSPNPDLRDLAHRTAIYLYDRGDGQTARELVEHLYRAWCQNLGPNDPHALRVGSLLMHIRPVYSPSGRARQFGEDILAQARRSLGVDHPDTLQAAHWLASFLHNVGAVEHASMLNGDTLERRRRVLGEDHIDYQLTVSNLARNLHALGEFDAARRLQEGTIVYRRRILGDDHPLTINATNELGATLRALGQIQEARQLHETAITCGRRVLGQDHPWTMKGNRELASDLHALAEFEAARQLNQDTLARARRVLGEGRSFTIGVANNLATDLLALGEHESARQLSEDILARAQCLFGGLHPLTQHAAAILAAARHTLDEEPDR